MPAKRTRKGSSPDSQAPQHDSGGGSLEKVSGDLLRKLPPQSLEAEQAVLGGIFLRNSIFHTLVDLLTEDDFYSPVHRTIYLACQELYRRNVPIDLVTVAEDLKKNNRLEDVGGALYLTSLTESVASASNAIHYAHIVREKSIRRNLIQTASEIIAQSFDGSESVEALLDGAEQQVFAISESRAERTFKNSRELVHTVFEHLEKRVERKELVTGVPTSYHKFDELTAGLQPSDLVIVAGRPSMGKTAFALNVAMRAAVQHDVPTAIFSLEMSMEQLMM
ncbi:MAG: DnaB-like helicase N-terminal domain-containing protein, partial [Desulfohalobiaceae bacterium]